MASSDVKVRSRDEAVSADGVATSPDGVASPATASDRRARCFVWATWAAGLTSTLVVVLWNARDIPMQEDWLLVRPMTGHQGQFLSWLWAADNSHHLPLVKLTYFGLLKAWPDFRVGMIFSMLLLAITAAGLVLFMRRIRGNTRWTDAFFPIAFLGLGNWEIMGFGWELQNVLATSLACAVLVGVVGRGEITTGRALGVGACLVAIPLTGTTALPFATVVAIALIPRLGFARQRARGILACSIALTVVLTVFGLVGLEHPYWMRPSPSSWATAETAAKFLGLSIGPAGGAWWFVSALFVIALLVGAAYTLYRASRAEAWTMLAFLAAGFILALMVGSSRAGIVREFGMPDRYAMLGLPALCCAYVAYDRYGNPSWRRLGPGLLCTAVVAVLPVNIAFGFQYRDWYHQRYDTFASDIKDGVPVGQLAQDEAISAALPDMGAAMVYLKQAHVGVFSQLRVDDRLPLLGRRIDGLDVDGGGWSTLGGPASAGSLAPGTGQRILHWDYNLDAGSVPILGRSFTATEDWRGAGAIAITLQGQRSGRSVHVRVASASNGGRIDTYEATFADDQAGTHTVVLSWNAFNHVNSGDVYDLQGPIPLEHIVGLIFAVAGQGRGTLGIERVALVPGHGQLGWPLSSAADRRSLPPWR